jgi:hypothetical protein
MKKFCITVPVYTKELSIIDKIGLRRLYEVIGNKNYDVYFICPNSLDLCNYRDIYHNTLECRFDDMWFTSLYTYTQLCLQYDFYDKFSDYEYIFMYQLDSYIWEDKIEKVCDLGYDYIGGPIFSKLANWNLVDNNGNYTPKVGNGGCGWRKVSTFKDICDPNGEFRKKYNITDDYLKSISFEDKYFSNDIEYMYKLNKPSWEETLLYVWDSSVPEICEYLGDNNAHPICAHGIYRYFDHWYGKIPEYTTLEVVMYSFEKLKNMFNTYKSTENELKNI